jgi:hypothetical protein
MIRLAKNQLVFLLAATAAACSRDSTTEPSLTDTELRLEAVSATQLEGIVTEPVSPVPTVIVKTTTGRPVAGVKVLFAKQRTSYWKSEASVRDSIVVTDSRGIATPGNWKLSTEAGVHVLEVRIVDPRVQHVAGAESEVVSFLADAKAGPAALLSRVVMSDTIALPGDEIEGPVVRVTDRYGNSAGGVVVSFSVTGGGSIAKNTEEVRQGFATPGTWKLGPNPGLNSLLAAAPGLDPVAFNARALDAGAITWYDIVPQSVRLILSSSVAVCEDGTFEFVSVEASDALPGEWRVRQFGTYTISGTSIALNFSGGPTEHGTLTDNGLSFLHTNPNWVGDGPLMWTFVRRR